MRSAPVLVVLALLGGCALEPDPGETDPGETDDGADLGKADDLGAPATIAAARAYAEAFDFAADSQPSEIPRADAPATGPLWVRRAFAFHHAWEELDLGAARLYRWTVTGRRVWAIRTSTDGDDSFVELFDAQGRWLATGTGGYVADPGVESGFAPIIAWDEVLGAERDGIAPRDLSPEVVAFWAGVDAAGSTVTVAEARATVAALVARAPTTDSVDGFERAAARRALADRALRFTGAARRLLEVVIDFYASGYFLTKAATAPSIATTLGLPAALSPRIRFARVALAGAPFAAPGLHAMAALGQRVDVLPSGALPADADRLADALRAAGATAEAADHAVHVVGADVEGARVFAGAAFHISPALATIVDPGTTWFVASPDRSFISFLYLIPAP